MQWSQRDKKGTIIVCENRVGGGVNRFNTPLVCSSIDIAMSLLLISIFIVYNGMTYEL